MDEDDLIWIEAFFVEHADAAIRQGNEIETATVMQRRAAKPTRRRSGPAIRLCHWLGNGWPIWQASFSRS